MSADGHDPTHRPRPRAGRLRASLARRLAVIVLLVGVACIVVVVAVNRTLDARSDHDTESLDELKTMAIAVALGQERYEGRPAPPDPAYEAEMAAIVEDVNGARGRVRDLVGTRPSSAIDRLLFDAERASGRWVEAIETSLATGATPATTAATKQAYLGTVITADQLATRVVADLQDSQDLQGRLSLGVVGMLTVLLAVVVLVIHKARKGLEARNAELERRVAAATAELTAVLDMAVDAMIGADPDGVITAWNPRAQQLFGWAREEVLGRPVIETIFPPDQWALHEADRREYRQEGRTGVLGQRREHDAIDRDGRRFPAEVGVTAVDESPDVAFATFVRDITDRVENERALARAVERADEAVVARSAFLATMSHEIRTPLNAVVGMTSLLLDTRLDPEQQDYVETIRVSGDQLLALINDILDFSKIESGNLEIEGRAFSLPECIEGALDLVAGRATAKGLDLAYHIEPGAPLHAVGDITRVRQIVANLLSNAVKFTESGEVTVLVDAEPGGDGTQIPLHVAVRDTGIGIPADRMDRLFRSFSQVDASTTREYGGTGLGLAISQRLARAMGGDMWVESEPGTGSTFHFRIVVRPAPETAGAVGAGRRSPLVGRTVLIVDDNETNRRILSYQARGWGMAPTLVATPFEALDVVRHGVPFDIAVLDMHMPGMDGATLAARLREMRAPDELPLVLLSSLGGRPDDGHELFAAMVNKPVKPQVLHDTLSRVLGGEEEDAPVAEAPRRQSLRILIAEDNPVNQKVALRTLDRLGYRADAVGSGEEVLDALNRQPYDTILMDVQMPGMDGLEATRRIRADLPADRQPQIVAMTASAFAEDREACADAGMDDYISKPVRREDLADALVRAAARPGVAAPPAAAADPPGGNGADPDIVSACRALAAELGDEFAAEIIEGYIDEAGAAVADLRAAAGAGDDERARRIAHTLKSTSQTVGAHTLAARCQDIETGAADATAHTDAVAAEFEHVRTELRRTTLAPDAHT